MKWCFNMLWRKPVLVIFVIALAINLGAGVLFGIKKPLQSDAEYFLHIGDNIASGTGYVLDAAHSFWPDTPSMRRLPLWPFAIAGGLKLFPWFDPNAVARVLCLIVNACAAAAIAHLAVVLGSWFLVPCSADKQKFQFLVFSFATSLLSAGQPIALRAAQLFLPALLAGVIYAFHPGILYLALQGLSEPLFILLVALGLGMILGSEVRGQKSEVSESQSSGIRLPVFDLRILLGALLLGLSCLVRANFVLFPIFLCLVVGAWWLVGEIFYRRSLRSQRSRGSVSGFRFQVFLLSAFLFYAPISLWVARNYRVCGHPGD